VSSAPRWTFEPSAGEQAVGHGVDCGVGHRPELHVARRAEPGGRSGLRHRGLLRLLLRGRLRRPVGAAADQRLPVAGHRGEAGSGQADPGAGGRGRRGLRRPVAAGAPRAGPARGRRDRAPPPSPSTRSAPRRSGRRSRARCPEQRPPWQRARARRRRNPRRRSRPRARAADECDGTGHGFLRTVGRRCVRWPCGVAPGQSLGQGWSSP
jgi:hypothetical protein